MENSQSGRKFRVIEPYVDYIGCSSHEKQYFQNGCIVIVDEWSHDGTYKVFPDGMPDDEDGVKVWAYIRTDQIEPLEKSTTTNSTVDDVLIVFNGRYYPKVDFMKAIENVKSYVIGN